MDGHWIVTSLTAQKIESTLLLERCLVIKIDC
jgi:hypothetical protein